MPTSPSCDCGPNTFSTKEAEGDLKRYREKGPDPTTRALVDAIVAGGIDGAKVLDIGGGIGAVQLELLAAGAARAISVDASEGYAAVAPPSSSGAVWPTGSRRTSATSSSWRPTSTLPTSSPSTASCAATRTSALCSGA